MATEEKKGDGEEKEEEMKWWQLKRIVVGFWVIIILTAFGILQPILWELLHKEAPESAVTVSTLLTILIALFALGLTGFSVLIYEYLKEGLTARITKNLKKVEKDAREHIEKHVDEFKEDLKRKEEENKNRQDLFGALTLRSIGYTFWRLFSVWAEVNVKKDPDDSHVKKVSNDLIMIAIERAKRSLDFAKELPEDKYKTDIYHSKANLVYFLADAAFRAKDFELDKQDKKDALQLTNEILAEVSKQDYHDDYFDLRESCAWALQHLSEKKQRAHDILRELLKDADIDDINPSWREEINKKWTPFLEEENNTPLPL